MINLKGLKRDLINSWGLNEKNIIIKRKKKMILEQTTNGKIRTVRKSIIKIEIIE